MVRESFFSPLAIIWKSRYRVLEGVTNDVRQRYIGSLLGMSWVFLFPLLQLGIYAGLYSVVFKIRPSGLNEMGYVLLIFSGLVPLMAFNEALTAATGALVTNKNLLVNTVFPAELIPLRAALAAQVPTLFGLLITLTLGYGLGRTSWQAIFLVPIYWILLFMFSMGVGWILSLLTLVARDIQHVMGIFIMAMFVLSPFAYTPEMVPELMKPVIYLNPLSYFVLTFQKLICYGTWPDLWVSSVAAILGVGSFVGGFTLFQKAKKVFFDYA